jgi:hypothetical protein
MERELVQSAGIRLRNQDSGWVVTRPEADPFRLYPLQGKWEQM